MSSVHPRWCCCALWAALALWLSSSLVVGDEIDRWRVEDATFTAAWYGRPGAADLTPAERAASSEQWQAFHAQVLGMVLTALADEGSVDRESLAALLAPEVRADLLRTRFALWWRSLPAEGMRSRGEGGLAIAKGAVAEVLEAEIEKLLRGIPGGNAIGTRRFGNHELKFVEAMGPGGLGWAWGDVGDDWVIGIGSFQSIDAWITKSDAGVGAELSARMERVLVARPWASLSIELGELIASIGEPEALQSIKRMGFDKVERLTTQVGFDDTGYVHRSLLSLKGAPSGVIKLLLESGEAKSLPPVSEQATAMVASTWNLAALGSLLAGADDEAQATWAEVSAAFGAGFVIQHDAGDGGWINGFSMQIPVKDHAVAKTYLDKALAKMEASLEAQAGDWFPPRLQSVEYGPYRIYSVRNMFVPWGPTWCLTERALVLGTEPVSLRSVLDRLEGKRADGVVPEFLEGESLVTRVDIERLQGMPLGIGLFAARIAATEWRWQSDDPTWMRNLSRLTLSWPGGEGLRGLESENRLSMKAVADGVELQGRFSVPGSEAALLIAGGVGAAVAAESIGVNVGSLFMPAAARRTQAMNNLKMIALAMHNYHDTYNGLPGNVKDAEGKALLSWRVQLLPYLEQQALYDQFHMDEPWDSPHNLALVEKIPAIFQAPGSKAPLGKTSYLTIASEDGLFPDGEGVRFGDVLDGLSNTLMVVEANDEVAVEWTRPDDLQPDMELLLQLIGLRGRAFLGAMGDGSVRSIKDSLDPMQLEALITRAGGEVVDW